MNNNKGKRGGAKEFKLQESKECVCKDRDWI